MWFVGEPWSSIVLRVRAQLCVNHNWVLQWYLATVILKNEVTVKMARRKRKKGEHWDFTAVYTRGLRPREDNTNHDLAVFFSFLSFPTSTCFFYLLKVIFKPLTHLVLVLSFAYTNSINRFFAVLLCLTPVCLVSFMFFRPSFLNIRPINFTLSFPVEDFVSF